MNKYTGKIKLFLDNNLIKYYNKYNFNDFDTIKLMKNIFNNIIKDYNADIHDIKIEYESKIEQVHSKTEECIPYTILKNKIDIDKLDNVEIKKILESYSEFMKWCRSKFNTISLKKLFVDNDMYDEYNKLVKSENEDKNILNRILYQNSFVSCDIIQHAESETLTYRIYKGNGSVICIYSVDNNFPDMKVISYILSFVRKLFDQKKKIKLNVFYGRQKKYLGDDKYLSCDNVNTGATTVMIGSENSSIEIWRKEEFYKVLIHELIHAFELDFCSADDICIKIENIFKEKFKINGDDRVNEAYTECLALIIHSVIYSILTNNDLNEILSYEILFTQFQIAKILNHYNYDKFESNNIFYQYTSVCSYYVVKYMLIINYTKMFNYWNLYKFNINKHPEQYIKLYKDILSTQSINNNIVNINEMIQYIKKNDKKSENNFVYKTLRMTLFSL